MAKFSNRFWFQLHGWSSLPIWIIFCFVCLTGTISVLSHELTWLTNPNARANNPDNLPEKSVPTLIAIVEDAHPTAKVTTAITFEPYLVNAIVFTDSDKPFAIAYVNQYTGEIQEVNQGITFISFMRSLHGWLLFPWHHNYSVGYYLVCLMSIVMLAALVTGLVVYKNFWRAFTQPKLRFTQGKRTFLADLHKLSGVWSIWFLLLMSITGLWYLLQAILWHNDVELDTHAPLINAQTIPYTEGEPAQRNISLSQALIEAETLYPDFKPTYVMPPEHFRDNYKLYGKGDHIFYDQHSYGVIVDPWSGLVTVERAPEKMGTLETISHIAHPLHYGTIGGIYTKIIWFMFGVLLTGMSITGFMMWGSRTLKSARQKQSDTLAEESQ